MSEITPEKIREFLDLELGDNDSGAPTARGYLLRLLGDVWTEGEGFDGKRPFGNSSWEHELYVPMVKAGLVDGKLDSDGYVETFAEHQADELVHAAIAALDAPREQDAPGSEPAKVIVVERDGHSPRRFSATGWEVLTGGAEAGDLVVAVDGDEWVAQIGARMWDAVYLADAEAPDSTDRALGIAKRVLTRLAEGDYNPDKPGQAVFEIARDGLAEIFAETE